MNFTPQQQHSLLSKMGYSGPVDSRMMEQFIQSNPGAAAKMGKFDRAMKRGFARGGKVSGYQAGGLTSPLTAAKKSFTDAQNKLIEAERISSAWAVANIETKEESTPPTQPSPAPTQPSPAPTQPSPAPTQPARSASQQRAYDLLHPADKAIVDSQFGGNVPGYMFPGGDR